MMSCTVHLKDLRKKLNLSLPLLFQFKTCIEKSLNHWLISWKLGKWNSSEKFQINKHWITIKVLQLYNLEVD